MIAINTELVKVIQTGKAQYIQINYSSVVTGLAHCCVNHFLSLKEHLKDGIEEKTR